MRAAVPFLLLSIPLVEIALFVVVGDAIGLWATLAATLTATIVGVVLIRSRGLAAVRHLRPSAAVEAVSLASVVQGATIVMAGMLLLIPGFLTDLLGLSLLLPPVRRALGRMIGGRVRAASSASGFGPGFEPPAFDGAATRGSPFGRGPIIDGDAVVVRDDPTARPGSPTGSIGGPSVRRPDDPS